MRANLTIDARWLVGGIGTYTRHLLHGLRANGNGFNIHAITTSDHKEEVEQCCDRLTLVDERIYTLREQLSIPRVARKSDLLHVPHYNAPLLHAGPLVVTVHDVIHLTESAYRKNYKSWSYAWPMLKLVTRKARHIITVSEYSKAQIVERLGVPESKITTIYNGVNGDFRPVDRVLAQARVSEQLAITGPYLLYVGSLKAYKNVSVLLRAFALSVKDGLTHKLLIVGDDPNGKSALLTEASVLGIQSRTAFVPQVSSELLPFVYSAADAYLMASKVEGFGLPVLEAMACGTPVICSRAASLPEIGGDAVLYFDPDSAEELAGAITRVLKAAELGNTMRKKGISRAQAFTWKESARKHVEVYQKVLE